MKDRTIRERIAAVLRLFACMICMTAVLAGSYRAEETETEAEPVSERLSMTSVSVPQKTFTIKLWKSSSEVTWSIGNPTLAEITRVYGDHKEAAVIRTMNPGDTVIRAKVTGGNGLDRVFECPLHVYLQPYLNHKTVDTHLNSFTVKLFKASSDVKWTSSNANVVSIVRTGEENHKAVVAVGNKTGQATLTATTKVDGQVQKFTCKVNVTDINKISATSLKLKKGDEKILSILNAKRNVKWTSSNPKVATVSWVDGTQGKQERIKARGAGWTTLIAKIGTTSYKCRLQVKAADKMPRIAVANATYGKSNVGEAQQAFASRGCSVSVVGKDADPSNFDGLVLPGGADVNPNYRISMYDNYGDDVQFTLYYKFKKAGKPILGLCRGLQLINVAEGGTLQNITGHSDKVLDVTILPIDSLIRRAVGSGVTHIATKHYHHQAIAKLGRDLVVTAKYGNIIEGIESTKYPIYGTQFHPEMYPSSDNNKILMRFCDKCRFERDKAR